MKIRLIRNNSVVLLPTKGTIHSAGFDLSANVNGSVTIKPQERKLIDTGISLAIPEGYFGMVCPRSGLALKFGITILNSPGIIDSDYRGEIKCILVNHGESDFIVANGARIAQLIIVKYQDDSEFVEISKFNTHQTGRGEGGFGSTGF
ncbi:MAG: dUTP diphosphatase [Holosporales bacterium]|jgi:dUTP pyrophosphatase|nr:dUTP diphosphatase [Holosporales bacterium]